MKPIEKPKVIILDDERFFLEYCKKSLSKEAKVNLLDTFLKEDEMFEYLENESNVQPDMILLDMEYKRERYKPMWGVDIAKEIKKKFGDRFKVIIISSKYDYSRHDSSDEDKINLILKNSKAIAAAIHPETGAKAFVSKNDDDVFGDDINRAIRCIARGENYFFNAPILQTVVDGFRKYVEEMPPPEKKSPEDFDLDPEKDILHLQLIAAGKTNDEISEILLKSNGEPFTNKGIDARQKEIAYKLKIPNYREVIITKAIKEGLIDPYSIEIPKMK